MGKSWDRSGVAFDSETWRVVLDALKPGGHLVAFGGARTFHRMTVAIEDAGFEIRDCLSWLYGSGFPKSHNLDGKWDGWGTALKPAWEPIILARKPFRGTVAANVAEHGTGAINVDGCRIDGPAWSRPTTQNIRGGGFNSSQGKNEEAPRHSDSGRWPANVVIDEDAAAAIDAQSGERPSGGGNRFHQDTRGGKYNIGGGNGRLDVESRNMRPPSTGGASRFYYCAKASRSEREIGMDGAPQNYAARDNGFSDKLSGTKYPRSNNHPTVKPVSLMQWLVRMVTPPGGTVLDPFLGSGSTGIAARREGFHFIGVELSPDYLEIARRRIHGDDPLFANIA